MIAAEVEVVEVIGTSDCTEEYEMTFHSLCKMRLDDGPKPCDQLNQTQESINVNGFQVLPSQVNSAKHIFERHPDIAAGFRSKNQHLRKTSMNSLLNLIETLCQSLEELSSEDLEQADVALTYLKDSGFKLDWLEKKLDLVKVNKEKEMSCLAILQETEESLLNLKQKYSELKGKLSDARITLSFDDVV